MKLVYCFISLIFLASNECFSAFSTSSKTKKKYSKEQLEFLQKVENKKVSGLYIKVLQDGTRIVVEEKNTKKKKKREILKDIKKYYN